MDLIHHYSYFGLLTLIFVEEAGVPSPIPSDLLIAAVSSFSNSNYFLIVGIVVFSASVGSTILFTLARKFGHSALHKYGKYVKITPEKIAKMEKWFEKYGGFAILIGRLIPGLRIVTPFVAGLFKVDYKVFWIYTTISAFIWANIYFVIGRFFAEIIPKISVLLHHY